MKLSRFIQKNNKINFEEVSKPILKLDFVLFSSLLNNFI